MESTFERSRSGLYIPKKLDKLLSNFYAFRRLGDPLFNRLGARGMPWGFGPRIGAATYADKVIATGPIAYWILGEAAGLTAVDEINSPLQDGTYTGVTLGQTGIGDNNTVPLFDGINDFVNIYSVTLDSVFDGTEGTAFIWGRVINAAVWADGATRHIFRIQVDGNNFIFVRRSPVLNNLDCRYRAGGVQETTNTVVLGGVTDWFNIAWTWSRSNNRARLWIDANLIQTHPGIGLWAGPLSATQVVIGAEDTIPAQAWSGYEGHMILYDRELIQSEMTELNAV